jgi:D-alanyl-lipoteichoic acid acyltransferase DltB (MBOAT superfamily)
MFEALSPFRPSALPALLFLAWLPLFLFVPARHIRPFIVGVSLLTLVFVGGPWLAAGLVGTVLLGYLLVESAVRLRTRRGPACALAVILLHLAYFACFHLPLPAAFRAPPLRTADGPGVFIFFSGIALTFLRLLSYFCDRQRGHLPPTRLTDYLAYMLYFPQFLHGPLERAGDFLPKLERARSNWQPRDVPAGLARIALGAAVLVFGALFARLAATALPPAFRTDPLAGLARPELLSLPQLLVLIHAPAVFLYLCESAFASIQLGTSRVFGVHGTENFRAPLLAQNPRDVWHRWNITFSGWLRDYAYIPLGGNRRNKYLNTALVFIYCGLLHSPQLRCLAWALWTGSTLAAYTWLRDIVTHRRRPAEPPTPRSRPHFIVGLLARLATFHWFSIGVTIILDPDYCGYRILRRYLDVLAHCFVP